MKYYEYTFCIEPYSETSNDVLSALLAEAGFETFVPEEEAGCLKAYIQQQLCDDETIVALVQAFPLPCTTITYSVLEPDDRDWNEEWEKEGFEPITIGSDLLICDTNHVAQFEHETFRHRILIHPRQAFGTGTHQTTRMILRQLMTMPLAGRRVVDAGCGTGILSFLCLQKEASHVFAYDIDEWSTRNTIDNAELNFADDQSVLKGERLNVALGDVACLTDEYDYDLLIANINRNILLGDIPQFARTLKEHGAQLLLSGFYASDVPSLLERASEFGFTLKEKQHDADWTMLLLER